MVSDSKFYTSFFNKILDLVDNPGEANEEDPDFEMKDAADVGKVPHRMKYLLHQLDIIPKGCRKFYKNLMRANPTSPLYLFPIIGVLGTNTARYSAVRRPSGHDSNVIRTGCFYNFIVPSRFGKGMVMRVLKKPYFCPFLAGIS